MKQRIKLNTWYDGHFNFVASEQAVH